MNLIDIQTRLSDPQAGPTGLTTHEHIVKQFDVELQDLKNKILRMAAEVEGQIRDTFGELEKRVGGDADWLCGSTPTQADVTVAVAWRFIHATASSSRGSW